MSQKRPFWPFWPVISETGWTSRKKVPLGIRLKSARRSHMRICVHVTPHRGENQKLRRGCVPVVTPPVEVFDLGTTDTCVTETFYVASSR